MKQQTIDKAVKSLDRSIQFYQRKLIYQLELKAEIDLQNGNLNVADENYMGNIMKYELILSDLATVKRAIKKGKGEVEVEVNIYGTLENRGYLYPEFTKALTKAGLNEDGDGYGVIWLSSIEELEEELDVEEEKMAMQLNGLMAEFEN